MADSAATLIPAATATSARVQRSRSSFDALRDAVVTDAVVHAPRLRAAVHAGGVDATPARFVMRGQRVVAPTGPVCWIATGAPDATGAQYPDGPSALDGPSIACVGRLP